MTRSRWPLATVASLAAACGAPVASPSAPHLVDIPRTWADDQVATFELPLANPAFSPQHVSAEYYYALPERVIWKSYPIYHPDYEPAGYRDSLRTLAPEVAFDASRFASDQDWIDGGALVFRAPISYEGTTVRTEHVDNPAWYAENGIGLTPDGRFPWARWVIRETGQLEVTNLGCAMCHTRLMPDGSVIEGAQGNFPFDHVIAHRIRDGSVPPVVTRRFTLTLVGTPWIEDPGRIMAMSMEEAAAVRAAVPPGVLLRQGTSFASPAKIPDLIGIRDRKYLDATGLVLHRGIGDLMRYGAANQGMDVLASFGGWIPATGSDARPAPGQGRVPGTADRYSDAQLYALARFLYSLAPPENPNPFDERARRGQAIFERLRCAQCHTPPLFTNNQLVPAPGFVPPADHYDRYDVLRRRVGTDSTLATMTRRGTGYYKVPSLKGVWYRGPLEHSGSVATLEDWFDPARLADDYVPTGFAGTDGRPRPLTGHRFGLNLSIEERRDLIAYLRTL